MPVRLEPSKRGGESHRDRLDTHGGTAGGSRAEKEDKLAQLTTNRLQAEFTRELVVPGDPYYDGLRRVFNGAVDRHPALIARCTRRRGVVAAVSHARNHGLEIAVHGGGHGCAATPCATTG